MKRRTYECYEIWTNYGKDDARFLRRFTDREKADRAFNTSGNIIYDHEDLYLLRVQVIDTYKRDNQDGI
jgi:hypothetical protein